MRNAECGPISRDACHSEQVVVARLPLRALRSCSKRGTHSCRSHGLWFNEIAHAHGIYPRLTSYGMMLAAVVQYRPALCITAEPVSERSDVKKGHIRKRPVRNTDLNLPLGESSAGRSPDLTRSDRNCDARPQQPTAASQTKLQLQRTVIGNSRVGMTRKRVGLGCALVSPCRVAGQRRKTRKREWEKFKS